MKPKPLSSLNHFTVPVAMFPPRLVLQLRGGTTSTTATTTYAGCSTRLARTNLPRAAASGSPGLNLAQPLHRLADALTGADARLPAEEAPRLLDRRPAALHVHAVARQVL